MADKDQQINEMHGMLHAMKPMLEAVREDTKAIDARVRASELQGAEHGVKIQRLQEDVDGLGRKIRYAVPAPPAAAGETPGKWAAFADFMGALPTYWHVIVSAAMFVGATVTMLVRHRP